MAGDSFLLPLKYVALATFSVLLTVSCLKGTGKPSRILVGRNIQVSRAYARQEHYEVLLAAHPTDPKRLLAGAMFSPSGEKNRESKCLSYASENGGKTWRVACVDWGRPDDPGTDPTVAYGPEGTAYFAGTVLGKETTGRERLALFRSNDRERTWQNTKKAGVIDRPFLVVDNTRSAYRGRLYCSASVMSEVEGVSGLCVFTSKDGGRTWGIPEPLPMDASYEPGGMCNPVVLSDGTLVVLYDVWNRYDERGSRERMLLVARSTDGGATFGQASAPFAYFSVGRAPLSIPMMAASPANIRHKDRLYAVWCAEEDRGARVEFAYSDNRGDTWQGHQTLSENEGKKGMSTLAFLPCIAVNRAGVVGVSWYDTRGLPAGAKGWNLRFRASLDGGKSWLSSVRVTEKVSRFKTGGWDSDSPAWPGHTAGLAVTTDGVFHPLWIDNRTGVRQVWTANVTIKN
jgi:hypothetical protein